jgi:protein-ribulosamine 3-kinase
MASPTKRADTGHLARAIGQAIRREMSPAPASAVHGGCIAESVRWETDAGPVFVKLAAAGERHALESEAAGLVELAGARAARIPAVLACGACETRAFLALEWIELGPGTPRAQSRLGEQLARQHRVASEGFGWLRDNTIGSTPQVNTRSREWPAFFRDRRLRYQLELARRNGHDGPLLDRGMLLLERMGAFFATYCPAPSLLHGDLWGGNWSADPNEQPVLFDPAVYYGDREADMAMTHLFGGFARNFYAAYQSAWPLDPGHEARRDLYNLYHLLNHLNLFGGGYRSQALAAIERLLAQLHH